jgi:hypothetical protein
MPPWFQPACVAVILLTLASFLRREDRGLRLAAYGALAAAGWIGEETCIRFYAHYGYAPAWRPFVGHVPLLVALIWPLVILSARDVARALAPGHPRALVAAAVVLWDASLVEVVAVRAGLWSWAEGGYLAVPLVGLLGWAYFAAAAVALIDRADAALRAGRRGMAAGWLALTVVLTPLATHAALLASWWGLLRWTLRGEAGAAGLGAAVVLGAALSALALRLRGARALPLAVAGPRVLAAALFFALLASLGPSPALWAHAAVVGVPYLIVTSYR